MGAGLPSQVDYLLAQESPAVTAVAVLTVLGELT
jgi:hypothetical protein